MYIAKKRAWLPWVMVAAVLCVVIFLFSQLRDVLMPFITAAVLAYILNPLVMSLERHGIRRGRASMWVMGFAFFILVGLLLVIVPMLAKQIQSIIGKLPMLVDFAQKSALPWFQSKFGSYVSLDEQTVVAWLRDNTQNIQAALQKNHDGFNDARQLHCKLGGQYCVAAFAAVLLFAGLVALGKGIGNHDSAPLCGNLFTHCRQIKPRFG